MPRHESKKHLKASVLLGGMQADMKSLNSSVLIITQKMKYLVRNEKILGRNLIVLNKKLKGLEEKLATGQVGGTASAAGSQQMQQLQEKLEGNSSRLAELQAELQQLRESSASKDELREMKYVVDSINPLQFVTLEQAKDLLKGGSGRKKK